MSAPSQLPQKDVMEHRTLKQTDEVKRLEGYDPSGINAPSVNDYSNNTPLQIEIQKLKHRRLVGVQEARRGKTWSAGPYADRLQMEYMHAGSIAKSINGEGVMMDNTTFNVNTAVPPPKPPGWIRRHVPGAVKKQQEGTPQQ